MWRAQACSLFVNSARSPARSEIQGDRKDVARRAYVSPRDPLKIGPSRASQRRRVPTLRQQRRSQKARPFAHEREDASPWQVPAIHSAQTCCFISAVMLSRGQILDCRRASLARLVGRKARSCEAFSTWWPGLFAPLVICPPPALLPPPPARPPSAESAGIPLPPGDRPERGLRHGGRLPPLYFSQPWVAFSTKRTNSFVVLLQLFSCQMSRSVMARSHS